MIGIIVVSLIFGILLGIVWTNKIYSDDIEKGLITHKSKLYKVTEFTIVVKDDGTMEIGK